MRVHGKLDRYIHTYMLHEVTDKAQFDFFKEKKNMSWIGYLISVTD